MRRRQLQHLALALVLTGCSAESPIGPAQFETAASNVPKPFSARCDLTIQPPQPIGPGLVRQLDVGECIVSHLGKSSFVSDKIINFAAGTQTIQAAFTAANGDVLRATGTGVSTMVAPGRFAFSATITFFGGTGRFVNASGEAKASGEADVINGVSSMVAEGLLTY
jgi:hypothetical protein